MIRMILVIVGVAVVIAGGLGVSRANILQPPVARVSRHEIPGRATAAQGQSPFFADGRSIRTPVTERSLMPAASTATDAGDLDEPDPEFLPEADPVYYSGKTKPDETKKEKVKVQKQRKKARTGWQDVKDKDGKT